MKHAFSNMIKIFVSKLLAYLVSTFCNSLIKKYTNERVVTEVNKSLSKISEVSILTRMSLNGDNDLVEGGK